MNACTILVRMLFAVAVGFALTTSAAPAARGQVDAPPQVNPRVIVDGKHPWVDTNLTVHKGERFRFEAEGAIRWGSNPDQVAGPAGRGGTPNKVGAGGLIGRVGPNGKPFSVGHTRLPIMMPKDGKLYLGINDFIFRDNADAFTVTIVRVGAP